jgi:hypothetical protein
MLIVCQPPSVKTAEGVIRRTGQVENLETHGIWMKKLCCDANRNIIGYLSVMIVRNVPLKQKDEV